jgi:transcriptional regulator with GAF, ATPase, and Fis domain
MESFWYHICRGRHRYSEAIILESLRNAGVTTELCDALGVTTPGVTLLEEITDEACQFLNEASDHGRRQILAIVLRSSMLNSEGVWRLLQAGATDVMAWDELKTPTRDVADRLERWQVVDQLLSSAVVKDNLVGSSLAWMRVVRQCIEVATFTDSAVLITGESGTGKELLARLIHTLDCRSDKRDLVVLDCTTVVPELSGSEFFGHERGAFTGAFSARDGAFALADRGTLFLDELGELPLGLQAQLLRVIQEHLYKRVGGNEWLKTDFRLVCATNRDISEEVTCGKFRSDLYYRVAVFTLRAPPLRERREDILQLIYHFLRQHSSELETPQLSKEVRDFLCQREYAGNVRELKQMVTRIAYRHVGKGPITAGDIPEGERPPLPLNRTCWSDEHFENSIRGALGMGVGLKAIGAAAERIAVNLAVSEANGNLQRAAQVLGVTDRALQLRRAAKTLGPDTTSAAASKVKSIAS